MWALWGLTRAPPSVDLRCVPWDEINEAVVATFSSMMTAYAHVRRCSGFLAFFCCFMPCTQCHPSETGREVLVQCADTTDCTAEIQGAFSNPEVDHIIIPSCRSAWNTLPLFLSRSNVVVTLRRGAILQARRGLFHGAGDTLLTVQSATNVTISGQGASLRMWRADYANMSRYNHSENRMGVTLKGVSNASIIGVTIAETGGDGIFMRWAKNVLIRDVITDGAYRNGLSVISATNLLVEGCTFANTGSTGRWNFGNQLSPMNGGTAPRAGVDLEPVGETEYLENVTFRSCVSTGNAGNGWDVSSYTNHTIVFENCVAQNCAGGFFQPELPGGMCSGFNFQNEIGAYRHPKRPWWTDKLISGAGSIKLIGCSAFNFPGAAIQLTEGVYRQHVGNSPLHGITNTFSVRNFTATSVARLWHHPYRSGGPHPVQGKQSFFPITIMHDSNLANGTSDWMDRGVAASFDAVRILQSNQGEEAGRPAIGCQDNTWMYARAQFFTEVPCKPTHLWQFHGRIYIEASNRSACSTQDLGKSAAGLEVLCGTDSLSTSEPEVNDRAGLAVRTGLCTRGANIQELLNVSLAECCAVGAAASPRCVGMVWTPAGRGARIMTCYLKSQLVGFFAGNCTTGSFVGKLPPTPTPSPVSPRPPQPAPVPQPKFDYVTPSLSVQRAFASIPGFDIRDSTTALWDPVSHSWHVYCTHQRTGTSAYQDGVIWHWSLHAERFDDPTAAWKNDGVALTGSGAKGAFDALGVFTPGAVRECSIDNTTCRWYLFFGGVAKFPSHAAESVGVAVARSPFGPFERPESEPVFSRFDRSNLKFCASRSMAVARLDEIKPVLISNTKYLAVKCVCFNATTGTDTALPVLYRPVNQSSWAPPYAPAAAAVSPMFKSTWTCESRGFEEPTFFTAQDGLLHFIAHNHGQCAEKYAHYVSHTQMVDDWVQVPPFGGRQAAKRACCNNTWMEPIPVPIRGDGVFGGAVHNTWIDFGAWLTKPSKSVELVFSRVAWDWSNASTWEG